MAYVRAKKVPSPAGGGKVYTYYQLVRGYREDGKVKQEVLAHLGPHATPEAALAAWSERAEWERQHARGYQHAADRLRAGRAPEPRHSYLTVRSAEYLAQLYARDAERFEARVARLRSVL